MLLVPYCFVIVNGAFLVIPAGVKTIFHVSKITVKLYGRDVYNLNALSPLLGGIVVDITDLTPLRSHWGWGWGVGIKSVFHCLPDACPPLCCDQQSTLSAWSVSIIPLFASPSLKNNSPPQCTSALLCLLIDMCWLTWAVWHTANIECKSMKGTIATLENTNGEFCQEGIRRKVSSSSTKPMSYGCVSNDLIG